ncbi:MAG: hypothetical protein ACRC7O_01025, partial [Fimbriiglobus sp.]
MRRGLAVSVVAILAGAGAGLGQVPAAPPAPAVVYELPDVREGDVLPIRTAGQPERRVRVDKVCRMSE